MAGMKIVEPGTMGRGLTPLAPPDAPPVKAQNWLPTWGAYGRMEPGLLLSAFGYDNDVVAALDLMNRPTYEPEAGFTPLSVIKGTRYEEQYLESFVGAVSERETRDIIARIDREEGYRRNLAAGGARGMIASMAAGVTSPISLVPVGGWLVKGGKGASLAVRSAEGAAMVGGSVAVQEGILQTAQETRGGMESALAIVMGAGIGAVLGPFASRAQIDALSTRSADLPGTAAEEAALWQRATSAGAAATADARGSGELAGAMGAERAFSFQDPLIRLQTSTFDTARDTIRDLAETPLTLAENSDGIATTIGGSVETRIKMARAPLASTLSDVDTLYSKYFFGASKRFAPARGTMSVMMGRGGGKLNYSDFKAAIGEAMYSGDVHAIPEVAEAAAAMRAKVFDPLKNEAIEVGLLPEDVKTLDDPSYLHRMYLDETIRARRPEFVNILVRHFEAVQAGVIRKVDALTKRVEEKQFEIDLTQRNIEDELARFRTRETELRASRAAARAEAAATGKDMRQMTAAAEKEGRTAERARTTQYRQLLADLKRGRPSERYSDINAFIRSKGGIRLQRDDATGGRKFKTAFGAEIQQALGNGNGRGIVRRDGLDPDAMLRLAIDEGYLRPEDDLNALVSAIDDTLKGNPVFSQMDEGAVQRAGQIREMLRELDQMGVDVSTLTPEDLARIVGDTSRPTTPAMAKLAAEIEDVAKRFDEATIKVEDVESLADDLKEMAPDLVEAARAGREAGRQAAGEMRALQRQIADAQSFTDMSIDELRSIADETTDTILGNSPSRILTPADIVQGPRGPLKERVLRIPTALISDFVEKDIEVVARRYVDTMAADIGLMRKFGSVDLKDQIAKLNDEANARIAAATTEKERKAIDARRKARTRDIAAVRDRLRMNYALPNNPDGLLVRSGRVVRNLNYLRLLGGMTLSAVPDMAKPVMVYGLTRTMRTAFQPFVRGTKTFKLAAKEVKLAGTALDMSLDSRAMAIADVMDDYGRGSKFERGLSQATRSFGVVSLMAPWNAAMKQFVGIIGQTKMLQGIERVVAGKASRKEIEYLAANGIDANMADRIGQQFEAHGVRDGDVWWANTEAWTDRQAVESIRAALVRDVDRVIVTPGQDKPLWMSTELGKLVGQFKSFGVSSVQRTLIAGLQQRDAAAFNGMVLMLGLGAISYKLKMEAGGFDVSDDPAVWATEAFDRSGLAGWIGDANNVVEKMTRGHIGLSAFTGEQASRYASRNAIGALLGPTFDTVGDAIQVTGSAAAGDWTASDTRAFRKLVPLQNLFYIRQLFDQVEAGANQALGIPQRSGQAPSARSMIR